MKTENFITVFKIDVANKLLKEGFRIKSIVKNRKDVTKVVFHFYNEGNLRSLVHEYAAEIRAKREAQKEAEREVEKNKKRTD